MAFPSLLLRALRPGAQVPPANTVTCGSIAAIVMHLGGTARLRQGAFSGGLVVATFASLLALTALFRGTTDRGRARNRAILWPPLIGGLAGATADVWLHLGEAPVSLAIAGFGLGGGGGETIAVALLGGIAGLLGTALLLPQIEILARARSAETEPGARLATVAERLSLFTWSLALGLAALGAHLATSREIGATRGLLVVAIAGVVGQGVRAAGVYQTVSRRTPGPYR